MSHPRNPSFWTAARTDLSTSIDYYRRYKESLKAKLISSEFSDYSWLFLLFTFVLYVFQCFPYLSIVFCFVCTCFSAVGWLAVSLLLWCQSWQRPWGHPRSNTEGWDHMGPQHGQMSSVIYDVLEMSWKCIVLSRVHENINIDNICIN